MHVGSKMGSIQSQMVDRDAPITNLQGQQTKHIKSKVVWFSVTATFYQLRRVLDNAACSGKCRQNFSSIPLRPKFWQHESIGMVIPLNELRDYHITNLGKCVAFQGT